MDLLNGKIKKTYFKYLSAAFGSAMISSIYGIVDMAVVGQYQGPDGTAALAVVAPVWNIIYSLGLLMGIGGSVLMSNAKGQNNTKEQKQFFATALIGTIILAALSWIFIAFFDTQLLKLFGAQDELLSLAKEYLHFIKFVVPLFLFNQMLAAFLRNDNSPALATAAVLSGGILNILGDYLFVFTFDMGITGAGLATAIGAAVSFFIMLTHFLTKKNTLKIVRPKSVFRQFSRISVIGMPSFIVDVSMGVLTMLFNRQIVRYLGTDALAVYGIIVNISTVVQCCAYSVGQASQPLISINYGAQKWSRIKKTLKYSIITAFVFGIIWTVLIWSMPNLFVRIFMSPTAEIYRIAPFILRSYGMSFLLLPLNIFSTFYFQSIIKPLASSVISVARGLLISGALILILPGFTGANNLWLAMPITEVIVAVGCRGILNL